MKPLPSAMSHGPVMTQARAPLTATVQAVDEHGQCVALEVPVERALTLYVDRHELVTLMTLGADPEHLALGYMRNQGLLSDLQDIEGVTVDWDVGAAAIKTRRLDTDWVKKTERRVITTGCGQGTMYGQWLDQCLDLVLPAADSEGGQVRAGQLAIVAECMRRQEDSTYRLAGSVHGCALFEVGAPAEGSARMLRFVEDVGRHNALDTLSGWMWTQGHTGQGKLLYTTGRLTSEMVMKSAQMGVPMVASRSGVTQLGLEWAQRLGLLLLGRVRAQHYLCYCGQARLLADF